MQILPLNLQKFQVCFSVHFNLLINLLIIFSCSDYTSCTSGFVILGDENVKIASMVLGMEDTTEESMRERFQQLVSLYQRWIHAKNKSCREIFVCSGRVELPQPFSGLGK